jgi:hypothetical protein
MHPAKMCCNKARLRGDEIEAALVEMIEQQLFSEAFIERRTDENREGTAVSADRSR